MAIHKVRIEKDGSYRWIAFVNDICVGSIEKDLYGVWRLRWKNQNYGIMSSYSEAKEELKYLANNLK